MRLDFQKIVPTKGYKIAYSAIFGCLTGLLIFGVYVSRVHSYLSNKPTACINCHIMNPFFITWFHSSHRNHTTCNDCHVPRGNIFRAYWFKINDGLRHSTLFTLNKYPQVIRIRESGANVVQENCVRCHWNQVNHIYPYAQGKFSHSSENGYCWNCHREVPHGRISSQSSTPYGRVPIDYKLTPDWLKFEK